MGAAEVPKIAALPHATVVCRSGYAPMLQSVCQIQEHWSKLEMCVSDRVLPALLQSVLLTFATDSRTNATERVPNPGTLV